MKDDNVRSIVAKALSLCQDKNAKVVFLTATSSV